MALYRKYRPGQFKDIFGQKHIKITLQNEISDNAMAHAYLFCGPRAVGKTTIARIFSKSINCLNRKEGEYEPCGKCKACEEIISGRSLDVVEIDAASHTGVDNVRENIIEVARVATSSLKNKVFIIDEVHMLSVSAFNALLKLLEEPPENVVFILCTTEVHKIPATIISRCQRFDFRKIALDEVVKKLNFIANSEGVEVDKEVLVNIARQSDGHLRDAESLFGQVLAISGKNVTQEKADLVIPRSDLLEVISLIKLLAKKDAVSAILLINRVMDDGIDLKYFLKDFIELLRKLMLSKISQSLSQKLSIELGDVLELEVDKILKEVEVSDLVEWIERFNNARNDLKNSFIAQLPVEVAITTICINSTSPTMSPVIEIQNPKSEKSKKIIKPKLDDKENDKAIDSLIKNFGGQVIK